MGDAAPFILFGLVFLVLLLGYPVALTLAGVSLAFAGFGVLIGSFDANDLLFSYNFV